MKKNSNVQVCENNSIANLIESESEKRVSNKVSAKANVIMDTANVSDLEDSESPSKTRVFSDIRALFGFSAFDAEEIAVSLASDLANGNISYKEFAKRLANARKESNDENEKLENLAFADVCDTLEENSVICESLAEFVGTRNFRSLESLLIANNKVVIFHGKQSENGEKFTPYKVMIKGLHKPYIDMCYTSYMDITTSNIIRAFRNYCYYLASLKRVQKQVKEEKLLFAHFQDVVTKLHKEFGYMPNDFSETLANL